MYKYRPADVIDVCTLFREKLFIESGSIYSVECLPHSGVCQPVILLQ